jgi:hypothetical protein
MTEPRTLPRRMTPADRSREIDRVSRRFSRRAESGADGRHWYAEARAWAESIHGTGAPLFLGMLAATSARAGIRTNLRSALRAYRLASDGRDTDEGSPYGVPANRRAVTRVARGLPLRGQKTGPYQRALMGDPESVAVDVWVSRAAGYRDSPGPREVSIVTDACRRVAARIGWTPAEVQAAVWTAERRAAGWKASETYREAYRALAGSRDTAPQSAETKYSTDTHEGNEDGHKRT